MIAQPPADHQILSLFFEMPSIVSGKQGQIRGQQSSKLRDPDDPSMDMPGQCQIGSPVPVCRIIERIVGQENLITGNFPFSQQLSGIL